LTAHAPIEVLAVGPVPPPYHGGAVATQLLLESDLGDDVTIIHIDTSDRRDLGNIGRIDFTNIALALAHFVRFMRAFVRAPRAIVYVPVAQNRLGFLRDCLFLVPARLLHRPIVIHVHGGYFRVFYERADPVVRALARWILADVRSVIVLGSGLRAMLAGLVPEARVSVVPNGVPDPNPEWGDDVPARPPGRIRVLYVGALVRTKGFTEMLEAARIICAQRADVEFVFAGDVTGLIEEKRLLEQALGDLPQCVRHLGVVVGDIKDAVFRDADIFVLPSYSEGHPYVILEAMAAGLPIITTDQGALPETVRDGTNGLIIAPRQVHQLKQAIELLADNPVLRRSFALANRRDYLAAYTQAGWAKRMREVFLASAD
jgi:glycosyltransferase involved in cell wall biosynthesis